ncbi:MAG TPA: DNA translocase FtsK [Armatimonadota bacterium]|nr:DNA translocase FtsK [Armatimonadota bacterium]
MAKTSRKKPLRTSRRRRTPKKNQNRTFDIIGIGLIGLGLIMLVALLEPSTSGTAGRPIKELLTDLVGIGAYVFPFLSILFGVVFIIGPITLWSRNAEIGGTLIFLVLITWQGLTGLLTEADVESSGGIIGFLFAVGLNKLFGPIIAKILLCVLGLIGLYVLVDVPIALVIQRLREMSAAGAQAARDRLVIPAASRTGNNGVKSADKNVDKAPAKPAVDEEPEPKRRLLPILVRKGDPEADDAPVKPDQRKIPVTVGHVPVPVTSVPDQPSEDSEPDNAEQAEFKLPPLSLLNDPQPPPQRVEAELKENVEVIERTLEEFKITGDVVEIAHGPTVTRYEVRLAPGIKVNKIVSLADNLAMSLAAIDVRVEAPIPGKSAIGVEVPNKNTAIVGLREVIDCDSFRSDASRLLFALGKDVSGESKFADLAKMPHLLVAGATNSGKSVCLNTLIASLLYRATPDELKLILIDPKRVELSLFDGIPHLACPVIKDARQAAGIFRAATKEMDNRYELIARAGCRNIQSYNEKQPEGERLPYLVIVCDELADLMLQAAAEVETSICRLAQLARAVGIHLVIATQRPSVDVITGLIKANISSRIAFAVSQQVDSRTILDKNGAERLIGRGDMLFLPIDAQKPLRIQGCYLSEDEIHRIVDFLKSQRKPVYTIEATDITVGGSGGAGDDGGTTDPLYQQAVRMIVTSGYASTSMIQRKFKIGYTRAARLVDAMEQQGIVGPLDGAKPREVLLTRQDLDRLFGGPSGLQYDDDNGDNEE